MWLLDHFWPLDFWQVVCFWLGWQVVVLLPSPLTKLKLFKKLFQKLYAPYLSILFDKLQTPKQQIVLICSNNEIEKLCILYGLFLNFFTGDSSFNVDKVMAS